MGQPAAKKGDRVVGLDTHIVMISSPGGPVPTPLPSSFSGTLGDSLCGTVFVDDQNVAVLGSTVDNSPQHIPVGGSFQKDPANKGTVSAASDTVFAGDVKLARNGDAVRCCNDPQDSDTGNIIASGTVFSG